MGNTTVSKHRRATDSSPTRSDVPIVSLNEKGRLDLASDTGAQGITLNKRYEWNEAGADKPVNRSYYGPDSGCLETCARYRVALAGEMAAKFG